MTGPGAGRREAREHALLLLYEADQRGESPVDLLEAQVAPPDTYTVEVLRGVDAQRGSLEALLDRHAEGWTLQRMAKLDRSVLLIACYELGHRPEVPTAVILNEAVELANRYSTDDSGRFVNGVLSAVADEVRRGTFDRRGRT